MALTAITAAFPQQAATQPVQLSTADVRAMMSIAGDSVAARLRADGRAHLYVLAPVTCEGDDQCSPALLNAVRESFATAAVATVSQPGQRWPTLCDNSESLRLRVPRHVADSAWVDVIAVRSIRGSLDQAAKHYELLFLNAGTRWTFAQLQAVDALVEPLPSLQPPWCSWSPESGSAVAAPDRTALTRSEGTTPISSAESCPLCRLGSALLMRLGGAGDLLLPSDSTPVYYAGRGRYAVQGPVDGQLLWYDSSGAFGGIVGDIGREPGQFSSIDGAALDAHDSLYVLDNRARRITVLTPELTYARHIDSGTPIEEFWVLRDGRLLVARVPRRGVEPVAILSSSGGAIRTFGASDAGLTGTCESCAPRVALAPSGYRVWLVHGDGYRLEEWDLSGRKIRTFERELRALRIPVNRPDPSDVGLVPQATPGIKRAIAARDGTLWISYVAVDALGVPVHALDIIDPARGRLVRAFRGMNLDGHVTEGVRAVRRMDGYGSYELLLERYSLERGR